MWDALNRGESYRDLAEECRRLAANSLSPQMRNRFSLMADDYSTLAEGRTSLRGIGRPNEGSSNCHRELSQID